jgi:hypothetical protein
MPDETEDGLQQPFLFRSYDSQESVSTHFTRITSGPTTADAFSKNLLIHDICKATSAAPSFFKGADIAGIKFRDSTTWISNPVGEIYMGVQEATQESNPDVEDPIHLLVSFGPGLAKQRRFHSPSRRSHDQDDDGINGLLRKKLDTRYCAFDGPSDLYNLETNEWRIDGSGDKTFARIQKSTETYCQQPDVKKELDRCAENLVRLRQQRAKTTQWERFALGIRYTCRESKCASSTTFDDKDSFMDHLMWEHTQPPQDEANWNYIQKILAKSQVTTVK